MQHLLHAFATLPFIQRVLENVKDALPSTKVKRTLSAARGTFSSASIGTARGRLLSVARKRSMSGDALGKVARAGATQGQAAGRKRSSSSMHASEGPAASRVPRGGHTAHDLASSSLARPWLHPHVVQGVLTD